MMNPKKLQILHAAKELFYKNGFADTSVTDIIKLANVSKGTFYNHFSSKSECMIAIFQDIHERSVTERKIIAHFNNRYDIATLEKELIAHFSIVIESNIADLMANNIGARDNGEIIEYIKSRSLEEVKWLGNRLNEIYGPRINNHAYDIAAMILGSIQQVTLIQTITQNAAQNLELIIQQVLRNFEPGIYSGREKSASLISSKLFIEQDTKVAKHVVSREEIVKEIEAFYNVNKEQFTIEGNEYTLALIDGLKNLDGLNLIIKSIAFSFVNSFKGGILYSKALMLFQEIEKLDSRA